MAQMVKCLPTMQETQVQVLGQEDPLEEGMETHSSILAWRIPWTEEPGGLQSKGLQRVRYDWASFTFTFFHFTLVKGFPEGSNGKESTCNAGDLGSIPELGRSPGEREGYPLQYSGLENSMDCIVHGIAKSLTRLSNFHFVLSTSYPGDILGICIQYYLGSLLLLFNHSSCLNSFAKPWNIACQACLSMGFSRHEY